MKAPFAADGSLLHYPETQWSADDEGAWAYHDPEWREFEPVRLDLRIEGVRRGRSAAYFVLVHDPSRCHYPMFMKDMADMLTGDVVITCGVISGTFDVRKRGQNYGIRRVSA